MYKYAEKRFNDGLCALGSVRVGTLHDYRNEEHKAGIADPAEGTKSVSHHIDHLHIEDVADEHLQSNIDFRAMAAFNAIKIGPGAKNIKLQNVRFSQSFNEPDCFVYCVSQYKSIATMREFGSADSCIQICDIESFFEDLTHSLNQITPVVFRGVHEVSYQDRDEEWNGINWGAHPAVIKERHFRTQGEVRAIWQPRFNQPIKPLVIAHHRLGQYMRVVAL